MQDPNSSQVEQNYQAFVQMLPALLQSHKGKFALMRDGKIVQFFDTGRDAHVAGRELYKQDGLYSVQEVTDMPIDLGYFSHAVP